MQSAGQGLWTWNLLPVLPQAGCVGQVESLALCKRERLKLMKRLRRLPALKLLCATAYKSDFHERDCLWEHVFWRGTSLCKLLSGSTCTGRKQAPWLAQVPSRGGPQAQPGRRGVA